MAGSILTATVHLKAVSRNGSWETDKPRMRGEKLCVLVYVAPTFHKDFFSLRYCMCFQSFLRQPSVKQGFGGSDLGILEGLLRATNS